MTGADPHVAHADSPRDITTDEANGIAWWNGLTEDQRAAWLRLAGTAIPAVAWAFAKDTEIPKEEELADLRHCMCSSDFWFSPHAIPQYDLLVAQGLLGRKEADDYRHLRQEAGLAMDIAQLKPQPCPELAWVRDAGGPALQLSEPYDVGGISWSARYGYGSNTALEKTDCSVPGGYLRRDVSPHHEGKGFVWHVTWKVPGTGDGTVYARSSGTTGTLQEALSLAAEYEFVQQNIGATRLCVCETHGRTHWVGSVDGQELEVSSGTSFEGSAEEPRLFWTLNCKEGTPQGRLAELFGSSGLRGRATSLKAAVEDAAAAMGCLREQCKAFAASTAAPQPAPAAPGASQHEASAALERIYLQAEGAWKIGGERHMRVTLQSIAEEAVNAGAPRLATVTAEQPAGGAVPAEDAREAIPGADANRIAILLDAVIRQGGSQLPFGTLSQVHLARRIACRYTVDGDPPLAAAAPAAVERDAPTAEFEVWMHYGQQGDEMVASASGPREQAMAEVQHYATQSGQDGEATIVEVTRSPVATITIGSGMCDAKAQGDRPGKRDAAPTSARGPTGDLLSRDAPNSRRHFRSCEAQAGGLDERAFLRD